MCFVMFCMHTVYLDPPPSLPPGWPLYDTLRAQFVFGMKLL